jgi:threonine/homoserine/homoserine lactone efflux protein
VRHRGNGAGTRALESVARIAAVVRMCAFMPTLQTFLLFAVADLALKLTPGPDMALTVGRGMTQGFRAAWLSVLGNCTAGFVQIPVVVVGLAAIFRQSAPLFAGVKAIGALYLVYLGVRALRRCLAAGYADAQVADAGSWSIFWQGFVTNLFNPKVLLFMIAFLPQFADPGRGPVWLQMTLLAVYQKSSVLVSGGCFAYGASRIRRWIGRHPWFVRAQEGLLGTLMVGLGGWMLFNRDPVTGR